MTHKHKLEVQDAAGAWLHILCSDCPIVRKVLDDTLEYVSECVLLDNEISLELHLQLHLLQVMGLVRFNNSCWQLTDNGRKKLQ